jgi:hypothetical protein
MMRDELLAQLAELPADADVVVDVGGVRTERCFISFSLLSSATMVE